MWLSQTRGYLEVYEDESLLWTRSCPYRKHYCKDDKVSENERNLRLVFKDGSTTCFACLCNLKSGVFQLTPEIEQLDSEGKIPKKVYSAPPRAYKYAYNPEYFQRPEVKARIREQQRLRKRHYFRSKYKSAPKGLGKSSLAALESYYESTELLNNESIFNEIVEEIAKEYVLSYYRVRGLVEE